MKYGVIGIIADIKAIKPIEAKDKNPDANVSEINSFWPSKYVIIIKTNATIHEIRLLTGFDKPANNITMLLMNKIIEFIVFNLWEDLDCVNNLIYGVLSRW